MPELEREGEGGREPESREMRFRSLYEQFAADVLAYTLRRCPRDLAADVTSDVFVVAWRRLDELPDNALPWLLGTARRVAANERRSIRRRHALAARTAAFTAREREGGYGDETGFSEPLATALSSLSGKQREALLLVAWEGLSVADAAQVQRCTAATFRVRLHRARVRFRDAFAAAETRGLDRPQRPDPAPPRLTIGERDGR